MAFSIPLSELDFVSKNVTLSDPRCRVEVSGGHLKGRTLLNACGTTFRFTNRSLIFANFLLLPPALDGDSITSYVERVIPIECHYNRVSELRLSYLPMVRQVLFTETGVGRFQIRIRQFQGPAYASEVADSAYPLRVKSSDRVYLQLSLAEWDRVLNGNRTEQGLEVETCVASPTPSVLATLNHSGGQELIRESCPANGDVRLIRASNQSRNASGPNHRFRFSFKPIVFSNSSAPGKESAVALVYIHCRVRLCPRESCRSPAECTPPPPAEGRRKRSVGGVGYGAHRRFRGHYLSTGPLLVSEEKDVASAQSPLVVALGAVAGMATLLALTVIVAWALTRKPRGQYDVTRAQQ